VVVYDLAYTRHYTCDILRRAVDELLPLKRRFSALAEGTRGLSRSWRVNGS
jgi:hypothetical protein